jgi:uncharacterized phage-associated protein
MTCASQNDRDTLKDIGMTRKLDVEKAIQAVGVLLRQEDKKATRLRILKLLYIADRISLKETGSQILGSRIVAMKHGPLHSEVLDLISGDHPDEPRWSHFFGIEGRDVVLSEEPGVGKLSRREIEILNDVARQRLCESDWDVADETHGFEEWKKSYPDPTENTSRTISLELLIESVGRGADKDAIMQDVVDTDVYDSFFDGICK